MSKPSGGNFFAGLPARVEDEVFETLFERGSVRIERIASDRHASPADSWYDQPQDEWVMLVQGNAVLEFADGRRQTMYPGDWITLPAHCRHRVAATAPGTLWLAVHADPAHPG